MTRILLLFSFLLFSANPFAGSLGDKLDNIFSADVSEDEILDPDIAFLLDTDVLDASTLQLRWQIEDGYYLYQNRFSVEPLTAGVSLAEYDLPAGKEKDDPAFGRVITNTGDIEIILPLIRDNFSEQTLQLQVGYQGCKEDSICYPPIKKVLEFVLPAASANVVTNSDPKTDSSNTTIALSEQDAITKQLAEKSLLINLAVFFGFGLLLALTPCVFPMIPILSGIIVGQGNNITTRKAFLLSLFYVLAMALTYAVLGIIAGSFNFNLQAASQNVWVILAFSLVFVFLALSMFGFYELQLPAAVQTRLNNLSSNQTSGSLQGAAIMGVLSAIIVGPCVAPPLAGALLYISQTGDAVLGGLALFAMGLGFGVPLMIIGTSAGKLLPAAGSWMGAIKAVFGVVMLGVAVWFLGRILPGSVSLVLWAVLLIVSAIFMGALDKLENVDGRVNGWTRLWKGLGLALLVYGCLVLVGATLGNHDVLNPLQNLSVSSSKTESKTKLDFKTIKSVDDLDAELQQAARENKTVMLDFYADWCITCIEMEKYTFSKAEVQTALADSVLLKADVTLNDELDTALLKHFDLFGPPAILFFNHGKEKISHRLVGFVKADRFVAHLEGAFSP